MLYVLLTVLDCPCCLSSDDDHSGTLDEEEFVYAMSTTAEFTEEEAMTMFKEIDADGSGEVTFDEFQTWWIANERKKHSIMKQADKDSDDEI